MLDLLLRSLEIEQYEFYVGPIPIIWSKSESMGFKKTPIITFLKKKN